MSVRVATIRFTSPQPIDGDSVVIRDYRQIASDDGMCKIMMKPTHIISYPLQIISRIDETYETEVTS